jgi:hypothetical protein
MRRAQLPYQPIHRMRITADAPVMARLVLGGNRNIDRVLVHVHPNNRGARLFHGLPPLHLVDAFVLNMWHCALTRVIHDTPEAGRLFALSHSV